ncbi:LOW QUALITY PROTEIN: hypothetical protein CVT25_000291 [Psilocybe cyanescens]|uniref:Uncharacterized protein n=1 Tax=Psilocybe cyanescens TaxID=93625 RepID=A0A409XM90_PSICY|nr:LOW QUALITY PROTEIN: hypothetical protein CVT25_000291 [Psilocybe cyanescens]
MDKIIWKGDVVRLGRQAYIFAVKAAYLIFPTYHGNGVSMILTIICYDQAEKIHEVGGSTLANKFEETDNEFRHLAEHISSSAFGKDVIGEDEEQGWMRKVTVLANLIPNTVAGYPRVYFVTEGEANRHFTLQHGVLSTAIKNGEGVDINSYTKRYKRTFLKDSKYINDLDHIIQCFDKTTKQHFRSAEKPQYVKFGSTGDNNAHIIYALLASCDVAEFFEPSVKCVVSAVLDQHSSSHRKISHIVMEAFVQYHTTIQTRYTVPESGDEIGGSYESYMQLCNIITGLSHAPLPPMTNPDGEMHYRLYYDVNQVFMYTDQSYDQHYKGVEKKYVRLGEPECGEARPDVVRNESIDLI